MILCCYLHMLGMLAPSGEEEGEKGGGRWELLNGRQMETQMQSGGLEKFLTCPNHLLCFAFIPASRYACLVPCALKLEVLL